jgi:hypothetical protein
MTTTTIATALCAAVLLCACAPMQPSAPLDGKPIDELVNDVKDELAEVHWRVRSSRPACGSSQPREVDLRQGLVTLTLERVAQVSVGGDVRLVAIPLGGLGIEPLASGDYARRLARTLLVKLEAAGNAPVVDIDAAPATTRPVAQALNAAIDGFMRSQTREPCLRLSALKLTLVLDVERKAGGGFRIVVPTVRIDGEAGVQAVNTLTLEWAHVGSNGFL